MNEMKEKPTRSSLAAKLISMILQMPYDDQWALLNELEERVPQKTAKGKRGHQRKPFLTVVDYASPDRSYKDFIQNISPGGVFIETGIPFSVGQEISLAFPLPKSQKHIKIAGEVVHVEKEGIGVKFKVADQEQETLIEALLEMI
ncbi:PilZ domain-containing protein [Thermodesulfobacteriota bacterium]